MKGRYAERSLTSRTTGITLHHGNHAGCTKVQTTEAMTTEVHTGSCLCGAVRYEVRGPLRSVLLCHCAMCRKTHGHIGAYSAAPREALSIVESRGLRWYRSSETAQRGFCNECGGTLFWQGDGRSMTSIAAGTLDPPTGLATVLQIYVDHAGDYYEIDERIPQRGD